MFLQCDLVLWRTCIVICRSQSAWLTCNTRCIQWQCIATARVCPRCSSLLLPRKSTRGQARKEQLVRYTCRRAATLAVQLHPLHKSQSWGGCCIYSIGQLRAVVESRHVNRRWTYFFLLSNLIHAWKMKAVAEEQ